MGQGAFASTIWDFTSEEPLPCHGLSGVNAIHPSTACQMSTESVNLLYYSLFAVAEHITHVLTLPSCGASVRECGACVVGTGQLGHRAFTPSNSLAARYYITPTPSAPKISPSTTHLHTYLPIVQSLPHDCRASCFVLACLGGHLYPSCYPLLSRQPYILPYVCLHLHWASSPNFRLACDPSFITFRRAP